MPKGFLSLLTDCFFFGIKPKKALNESMLGNLLTSPMIRQSYHILADTSIDIRPDSHDIVLAVSTQKYAAVVPP